MIAFIRFLLGYMILNKYNNHCSRDRLFVDLNPGSYSSSTELHLPHSVIKTKCKALKTMSGMQ